MKIPWISLALFLLSSLFLIIRKEKKKPNGDMSVVGFSDHKASGNLPRTGNVNRDVFIYTATFRYRYYGGDVLFVCALPGGWP